MLDERGGGEPEKRLGDPAQPPGHLHLESPCSTGDLSLIYEPTKFCYASLGQGRRLQAGEISVCWRILESLVWERVHSGGEFPEELGK